MSDGNKPENAFVKWCKDYNSDFKKIIFSFLMGYSSVIVVILILILNQQDFLEVLVREEVLYAVLGCCSSLLAVASVSIERKNTTIKLIPLSFNILAILPVFGFMSYFLEHNNTGINTRLLAIITILGVILSFYYLIMSTNEDRVKRKKFEEYKRDTNNLRKEIDKTNKGKINGKPIDV
jgi:glycopeptide antibiotics resistance protein